MDKHELCTAHAEWFGALLETIVVPIARDFMLHGIKHGEEASAAFGLWSTERPRLGENVYVAMDSGDGMVTYAIGWMNEYEVWHDARTGSELVRVLGWCEAPEWRGKP